MRARLHCRGQIHARDRTNRIIDDLQERADLGRDLLLLPLTLAELPHIRGMDLLAILTDGLEATVPIQVIPSQQPPAPLHLLYSRLTNSMLLDEGSQLLLVLRQDRDARSRCCHVSNSSLQDVTHRR